MIAPTVGATDESEPMKRIENILAEVHRHKTCTKRQIYRYLKLFNINPVGIRQKPQLYPDDAAQRILKQLGLIDLPDGTPVYEEPATKPACLVSMRELRHERSKAARRAA
jgi:hypothetical protein